MANLWSGFESGAHLKRFLILCVTFLILLTTCCWFLFYMLGITVSSPTIRIGVGGQDLSGSVRQISMSRSGLQIETRDGARIATVLVPADRLWVDTGLVVPPGARVTLYATGTVNLNRFATRSIVERPREQTAETVYHLFGPSGERIDGIGQERAANLLRRPLALAPSQRLGTLVGVVAGSEDMLRNDVQVERSRLFTIESAREGGQVHSGPGEGHLFLAVNDLLWIEGTDAREQWLLRRGERGEALSQEQARRNIQEAYLPRDAAPSQISEREGWANDLWDALTRMRFRNFFYEDNSGLFMVTIMITLPQD